MSTQTTRTTDLQFSSPDGRVWTRDTDHQDRPRTPMMRPVFDRTLPAGLGTAFGRLGAPLAGADACHVRGWSYMRMIPAGAPDKPGPEKTPPALLLKILTRVHPELRRREKVAREALAAKIWMQDVEAWWDERPTWDARFRTRQAVELDSLDDRSLADQLAEAASDAETLLRRHFELVTPGVGVGLAVLACQEHGIDAVEVAEALRGCSQATSAPVRALAEIRAADADEAHRLTDAYLAEYGWRLFGDDFDSPTLIERPDVLTRSIAAADGSGPARDDDPIATIVDQVATHDRRRIEGLVRDAGRGYEMMDDNSAMACWGLGLVRRFVIEAASRLVEAGSLADDGHVWVLDVSEVGDLLRGAQTPSPEAVAQRQDEFDLEAALDPPDALGGEPAPPPDTSVFPRGLGTIARAITTYLGLRFPPPEEHADTGRVLVGGDTVATGHGIGRIEATGRAVVARSADDAITRLEPGDVLVCPFTNPAYNVVFPIAAAVVTSAGGPFGHTAVTAREIGIPAVVGVGDLDVITDGTQVTVIG